MVKCHIEVTRDDIDVGDTDAWYELSGTMLMRTTFPEFRFLRLWNHVVSSATFFLFISLWNLTPYIITNVNPRESTVTRLSPLSQHQPFPTSMVSSSQAKQNTVWLQEFLSMRGLRQLQQRWNFTQLTRNLKIASTKWMRFMCRWIKI